MAHNGRRAVTDAAGYGLELHKLNTVERRIWETQTHFLEAYEKVGTIKSAAKAANVGRTTVYLWQKEDHLRFPDRFRAAKDTFREELEEIMFDRLRHRKTHPVLLIFALKGHFREKYGDVQVPADDTAKRVWERIRELARPQVVIEGEPAKQLEAQAAGVNGNKQL